MFDSVNFKFTNVIEVREGSFLTEVSFEELKKLVNIGLVKIDLSSDVPYVPLENGDTIFLNIDKGGIIFGDNKLYIKDKFMVADGAIRLINFMNDNAGVGTPNGKVMLNISGLNISEISESLSNITLEDMQEKTREFYNEVEKNKDNKSKIKLITVNLEGVKEIAEIIKSSDILSHEINNWVNRNNGDGYHRIIAVVNGFKADGKTDFEIAKIIKKMK